jgi:hypothetical protein
MASGPLIGAVFFASLAAIYLQVSLMKLVSVLFGGLFLYVVLGVALVGYGAAGSLLAARGAISAARAPEIVGRGLFWLAVLAVPPLLLVNALDISSLRLFSLSGLPLVLGLYALLGAPFLFAGLAVSAAFAGVPKDSNRLYFADLLGAGAGSALALASVETLGGIGLLGVAGVMAAVGAGLAMYAAGRPARPALVVGTANLLVILVTLAWHPIEIRIPSDRHGAIISQAAKPGGLATEFSQWSRFGRIDVTEPYATHPPTFGGDVSPTFGGLRIEQRMLMLNGAAPAFLYRVDGRPEDLDFLRGTSQSPAYLLRPNPRVLVIGVGGATDVLIALSHRASSVVAVELNPTNVHVTRDVFGSYVGNVLSDPRVEVVISEGRNFAARDSRFYDIVQLSGVDTGIELGALGLHTSPESYVYTVEALGDLMDRLAPRGMLSITRDLKFGWAARLAEVARSALRDRGLDPTSRVMVIGGALWGTILVRPDGFTSRDVATVKDFARRYRFRILYDPRAPSDDLLETAQGADLRPSTDDWPFFFLSFRVSQIADWMRAGILPRFNVFSFFLVNLIGLTIAALALILWPIWKLRGAWHETDRKLSIAVYFALLGAGFMLVELALMQRFTIFLGDPVLAVATVLAALLVSSGVGSWIAGRLQESGRDVVLLSVIWIVAALLIFASPLVPQILDAALAAPRRQRLALCIGLVSFVGAPMGMPFPTGLRRVADRSRELVPWGWGINGMFGVVASLASYIMGMITGYTAMFYTAAVLYLAVLACSRRF